LSKLINLLPPCMKINHRIMRRSIAQQKGGRARAPQRLLSKQRISSLVNKSCSFIKFHRQPFGSGTTECNALVGAAKLFQFAAAFRESRKRPELGLRATRGRFSNRPIARCEYLLQRNSLAKSMKKQFAWERETYVCNGSCQ
jgi:hypothetical protein